MQTEKDDHAHSVARGSGGNLLRIPGARISTSLLATDEDRVVVPVCDEAAWEGTEIDVRRKVL